MEEIPLNVKANWLVDMQRLAQIHGVCKYDLEKYKEEEILLKVRQQWLVDV